jgi:hypothetical protein
LVSPTEAEDFFSSPCVQTGSGAHPASYPMGTGGPFPGGKARPGRDADHSTPSSANVKYELELYLLSPHVPPWRVAGQLYFSLLCFLTSSIYVLRLVGDDVLTSNRMRIEAESISNLGRNKYALNTGR